MDAFGVDRDRRSDAIGYPIGKFRVVLKAGHKVDDDLALRNVTERLWNVRHGAQAHTGTVRVFSGGIPAGNDALDVLEVSQ